MPITFTSFSGRIEIPDTQFDDDPDNAKFPFNVPVKPPLRSLFTTVVISVFVPLAVPWSKRLYATRPVSLPVSKRR